MKRFLFSIVFAFIAGFGVASAADVSVSVTLGHPDFFGQIEIGRLPPPPVIFEEPRLVKPPHREVLMEPLYLRVPEGHARNWPKFCAHYNACDRRVYFVKDEWYRNVYSPHYREQHHEDRHEDHREDRHDDHQRNHHNNGHDDDHRHDHDDH